MRRDVGITLGLSLVAIISLWVFFYLSYSTNGLPLGWDTPYYVWKTETAMRLGAGRFIAQEGYYHILYPLVGSWISATGLDPFTVEILLPVLLWLAGFLMVSQVVIQESRDLKAAMLAIGAGSMWFALFRLGSDLHANLMALVLMLAGTALFLRLPRETNPLKFGLGLLGIAAILLTSSLSHVETTLFMSMIWLLTLSICLWRKRLPIFRFVTFAAAILTALVPGVLVYVNQLRLTTEPLGGRLPVVPTMAPVLWLAYLGPVGVGVLLALPLVYRSTLPSLLSSGLGALSVSWLILSLVIGLAQYAYPPLTPFSERAVVMTPIPLLAAIVLPRVKSGRLTGQMKDVAVITVLLVGGSGLYYLGIGHVYYESFISAPASLTLEELRSQRVIDLKSSIIVFYEDALSGGGFAEHDNFWASAYLGDHHAYFGRVDFLMAGLQTPFSEDRSELISRRFFTIPLDEIPRLNVLYLEAFNIPKPVPTYYQSFLRPVALGAYLLDQSLWKSQGEVFIPAFSSLFSSTEGWRSEPQDWAYSGRVLKFEDERPSKLANATIAIAIPDSASYSISLRVWDTSTPASSVSISLDGIAVRSFVYNGTFAPTILTVFSGNLERGIHYLSFTIQSQGAELRFLSLDYISIKS